MCCAAIVLAGLAGEPSGILAAVAAVCIHGKRAWSASERHLKSIVENIPGMVGITDPEGRRDANQRLLDYVGPKLPEATDEDWAAVIHPDDRPWAWGEWRRCMKTGEPIDLVCRRRRFDGAYRWFHVRAEPVVEEHGRINRWYSPVVDVDEQKRAEDARRKSEQQLRQLVDAIPALVWSRAR
jgi:PAS domain S-box-containing protein